MISHCGNVSLLNDALQHEQKQDQWSLFFWEKKHFWTVHDMKSLQSKFPFHLLSHINTPRYGILYTHPQVTNVGQEFPAVKYCTIMAEVIQLCYREYLPEWVALRQVPFPNLMRILHHAWVLILESSNPNDLFQYLHHFQ